jgi:anti-anti-sigma factor
MGFQTGASQGTFPSRTAMDKLHEDVLVRVARSRFVSPRTGGRVGRHMAKPTKVFPHEVFDEVIVVIPEGDALGVQETQLRGEINAMHELLERPASKALIVDLGRAKYFSSIVVGAVLTLCSKMKQLSRPAALCNATEAMLDVIQIMKLDTVFPYHETRDDALRSVRALAGTARTP